MDSAHGFLLAPLALKKERKKCYFVPSFPIFVVGGAIIS